MVALLVTFSSLVTEAGALRSSSSASVLSPGVFLHTRDDELEDADEDAEATTTAAPKAAAVATTTAAAAPTAAATTATPKAATAAPTTGPSATTASTATSGPATSPPTLTPGAGVCFAPNRGTESKIEFKVGVKRKTVKYCACSPGFGGLRCSIEILKTKEMAAISLPGSSTTSGAKQHTPTAFVKSRDVKTGKWEVESDALEYSIADQDGQMVAVLQPSNKRRADLSLNTVVGADGCVHLDPGVRARRSAAAGVRDSLALRCSALLCSVLSLSCSLSLSLSLSRSLHVTHTTTPNSYSRAFLGKTVGKSLPRLLVPEMDLKYSHLSYRASPSAKTAASSLVITKIVAKGLVNYLLLQLNSKVAKLEGGAPFLVGSYTINSDRAQISYVAGMTIRPKGASKAVKVTSADQVAKAKLSDRIELNLVDPILITLTDVQQRSIEITPLKPALKGVKLLPIAFSKGCPADCGRTTGTCDHSKGVCACKGLWTGSDCRVEPPCP